MDCAGGPVFRHGRQSRQQQRQPLLGFCTGRTGGRSGLCDLDAVGKSDLDSQFRARRCYSVRALSSEGRLSYSTALSTLEASVHPLPGGAMLNSGFTLREPQNLYRQRGASPIITLLFVAMLSFFVTIIFKL